MDSSPGSWASRVILTKPILLPWAETEGGDALEGAQACILRRVLQSEAASTRPRPGIAAFHSVQSHDTFHKAHICNQLLQWVSPYLQSGIALCHIIRRLL